MSASTVFQVDAADTIDDDATTVDIMSQQQIEQTTAAKLARSLWGVGSLTLVADASTMLYQPARGPVFANHGAAFFANHGAAYYAILAAILAVVALEMATAYCLQLSRGQQRRLVSFAKGLLLLAGLLLLFILAVGGFALTVKAP